MSEFAILFLLITQCVVPNSTVDALSRSSNYFYTIFPMASSLLYPSALCVLIFFFFTISSWGSNWLSLFYKWGSETQKDWDLKCNFILSAQSEMSLFFIDLCKCRALPFPSLSMTYFFWPYSNLSPWVDKRRKIAQSEIIHENNLPENLMVRAEESYWYGQSLSAFTIESNKVTSFKCNPLLCAPSSFRSTRQTIDQGSLRQLSPLLHNLDSGPE